MLIFYQSFHLFLDLLQVSDIHGYIAGQRHFPEYADLPSFLSYKEQLQQQNPDVAQYSIVVGDLCEGTGLSDLTSPKCAFIYEAISMCNFTTVIPGNHDIQYADTVQWVDENRQKLFQDRYLASNVYFSNGTAISNQYKYETISNLRILTLSLVVNENNFTSVFTTDYIQALTNLEPVLSQFGEQTDLVVLALHMGYQESQIPLIYDFIRKYFQSNFNYQVPIAVLTAHSHSLNGKFCDYFGVDSNCFATEAGYYLKYFVQARFEFERISIQNGPNQFIGSKLVGVDLKKENELKTDILADSLNQDSFVQTTNGIQLLNKINEKTKELGIDRKLGHSKFNYIKNKNMRAPNSIHRLWTKQIFPTIIFNDQQQNLNKSQQNQDTKCQQITITDFGGIRSEIYKGDITESDIQSIMPFDCAITYFQNVSLEQITCAINELNKRGVYDHNELEGTCVDLVTNSFNQNELGPVLGQCGFKQQAIPYETREKLNSTNQIFVVYVQKHMQDHVVQQMSDTSGNEVLWITISSFIMLGVLVVFLVALVTCKGKQNKLDPIIEDESYDSTYYDKL
ncbi:5'_nucleotidase family protein [Hexamita inflata]|uniref:5' nucleotidase family protein n=1 Tax=Hexamita inflata TaxID=28002 RepID=A0AA86QUQ3_9EUKA|nr:5' nucleotidase family protein [Hexamita inflata]